MEKSKITPETEVSTAELACILGLTGRRIRQMVEDGELHKIGQGRFLLCDSVQQYIKSQSKHPEDAEAMRLDREKRSADVTLRVAKAQIAKLEAEELEGKMHRSEDVAAMTEDLIYTIRGAMNALPGRLAVDVAAAGTAAEAAEIIRREVYKIMGELASYRYDPKKYEERVRERRSWDAVDFDEEE